MNILIIGGTRFIGAALARKLAAEGHTVAVYHRGQTTGDLPASVQHLTGDVNHIAAARDQIAAFAPEAIVHNIVIHDGHARDLLALAEGIARRVVMTSSMDVYRAYGRLNGTEPGEPLATPAAEDSPLRAVPYPYRTMFAEDPAHPLYRYDKIPAEEIVMSGGVPGTVLRLPMVFGPGDAQRRLLPFARPMADGRPALLLDAGYAAWQSTYGFVENVAAAMALAVTDERAAGRIYNVADGVLTSAALAAAVRAALAWPGEIVVVPSAELPESLRPGFDTRQHLAVSAARIGAELGYVPPVTLAEGIRRTALWDAANLPAEPADYSAEDAVLAALGGEATV
jgi:nucleoside-diphosphate-sugar epimerase